ncbi:hypothetical protein HHX47_DHR9000455 [Lentinula edodes]|nr:hypothetical protein HHX47_DHR9000455 [Lentinula edodes]
MSSPPPSGTIFEQNPYENHPSLSAIEAEVLWEYAKLAQNVKLFKASVWNVINEQPVDVQYGPAETSEDTTIRQ